MSRNVINRAAAAGTLAFLLSLIVHFLVVPPERSASSESGATPIEQAEREILDALEARTADHNVWRRATGRLLREEEPALALRSLIDRLPPEAHEQMAAGGFTGYYLGYTLASGERSSQAYGAYEVALEAFRRWDHRTHAEAREWLGGYDVVYEARTLMRLARHNEAARALDGLIAEGAPEGAALVVARTLAEIGRREQAAEGFDALLETVDDAEMLGALDQLVRSVRDWRASTGEPVASRMLAEAMARRIDAWPLAAETERPAFAHFLVRWLAVELHRAGSTEEAAGLFRKAEAAARRWAERETSPKGAGDAWRWVVKHRANLGDSAGIVAALERARELGAELDAEGLLRDPDMATHVELEAVREAIGRLGGPRSPTGTNAGG